MANTITESAASKAKREAESAAIAAQKKLDHDTDTKIALLEQQIRFLWKAFGSLQNNMASEVNAALDEAAKQKLTRKGIIDLMNKEGM